VTARALAFFALAWGAPAAAQRSLAIERFDATIQVEPTGAIRVTESIVARFTGAWNGIYRAIPVAYRTAQGLNWTLGLELESATDDGGRPLRVEASRERHYVKYKIWVPGAENARRTVLLRYRATNGLRFFDEHDELYWNVTGDEWDVPIEAATARIELPPGAAGVRAIAFNGVYGATAQDAKVEVSGTTVRVAMPHALGYREGLTAVVGWNKGVVAEPGVAARVARALAANWPLVIPIPVFFIAFAIWRRRGKDPAARPITVLYEPPRGFTPAEAGVLIDNSADERDITATLVDLAVRGYLRIEESGGRRYVLQRLDPPADAAPLVPHERRVFDGIFSTRGRTVELAQLHDEFYAELRGIRHAVFDRLRERGFYTTRPDHVRARWLVGAAILGTLVAAGGGGVADRFLLTPVPFVVAGVLTAVIVAGFGLVMPARTVAGARALEQVLGFEEFLRRVEAEHLKRVIIGRPELFDRYLPYAMAFGVEQKWAKAFEGIYTEPPKWYVGPDVRAFSVGRFASDLAMLSHTAGSAMTSAPRSSSGSGFGGGGGGGGFSGGGGGGGGGGGF
jgi:hypothetical protein